MSSQGGTASTSEVGKSKESVEPREGVRQMNEEKLIKLLTTQEFRERFYVLGGIVIHLMDDGPVSTDEESFNAIIFSKE